MNAANDDSGRKPTRLDEIVDDRRVDDRRMGWDERDGSKAAAGGGALFLLLTLVVFAVLAWCPKYPY